MNKYIVIGLICLTCLLTACGYTDYLREYRQNVSGSAVSGGGIYSMRRATKKPEITPDVVSGAAVSGSGIHSADNVTAFMQTADYWIGKTVQPDKILMSDEEIKSFNKKMTEQLAGNKNVEYYNLAAYGDSMDGEQLSAMLSKADFSNGNYYAFDVPVTEEKWTAYYENQNEKVISNFNTIRYGVICSRADVRALPTADYVTNNQGDKGHDILQYTALAVNEPVLVLHTSKDGEWFFVMANEYAGWVKKETVGLCRDKAEWNRAQEMKRFLVVTGDTVRLEKNPYNVSTSQCEFTMGTRLALAEEGEYPAVIDSRNVYDNYVIKVPVRKENGMLSYEIAMMPLGKDVKEGYLEYTRANVLRLAFKMLGNLYGWGGMYNARDCSSMTRDIYLCFGFRLPRDSSAQALIPGEGRMDISKLSDKEKTQKMYSVQPGTILQMPGHVMIYLGCESHNYYVISANGSFVPDSVKGDMNLAKGNYTTRTVTVNDLNMKSPGNGKTWLSQLATIVGIP